MIKLVIVVAFVVGVEPAKLVPTNCNPQVPSGSACSRSRDCPRDTGQCCRDSNNRLLDPYNRGRWNDFDLLAVTESKKTGTCKPIQGRNGEACGTGCPCGPGLECYRELTGVCCAPSSCQPEEYVRKKEEYWKKCFSDPNCRLPQ